MLRKTTYISQRVWSDLTPDLRKTILNVLPHKRTEIIGKHVAWLESELRNRGEHELAAMLFMFDFEQLDALEQYAQEYDTCEICGSVPADFAWKGSKDDTDEIAFNFSSLCSQCFASIDQSETDDDIETFILLQEADAL